MSERCLQSSQASLRAIAARQEHLVKIVEKLEAQMTSVVLTTASSPNNEVIEALQSLDLLRQSCADSARLLSVLSDHVEWADQGPPSSQAISNAVDMQQSLEGFFADTEKETEINAAGTNLARDIWL